MIYKCPVCGKEFRRRVILNLHRSSHAKFKYKCQICGKVFLLRYQVLQHQRLHGAFKLRQCKTYPEVYKHLSGLMKNSRADFSGWPFKCKKCPSSFLKSPYLSAHLFRVHAIVTNKKTSALINTNFRMVDHEKSAWKIGYQQLLPVGKECHNDQNASTLGLLSHVQQGGINDKSSVRNHGLSDKSSVQHHGLSDKSSVQHHGLSDKSSVQHHGLSDKSSMQHHGLSDKSSVPHHGLSDKSSVQHHGLSDKSSVPHHGLSDKSSVQHHGLTDKSSVQHHGLSDKSSVQHHGLSDKSSVQHHGLSDKSSVQHHGLSDKSSMQHHGLSDKSSVPHHGLSDKSSVPHHGLSDKSSVPHHGLSDKSSVPHHGLSDKSSVQHHGLSDKSSVQHHGVSDKSSVQHHGLSDKSSEQRCGLTRTTGTSQKSPLPRILLESPRKSPGQLAKQRLLKKYQRFHNSYPVGRRLCLDKNPSASGSDHQKSPNRYEELTMPRLREIKVVLEDVRFNGNNGVKVLNIHQNQTTLPHNSELRASCYGEEEDLILQLSDTSDVEEDSMPHLHRVSSEEKACDSDDWQSDTEGRSDKAAVSVKTDGFKEREGLFEVLQHEHVRSGKKRVDYEVNDKESSYKKHRTQSDKVGLNGLIPLKSRKQSSTWGKVNSIHHRTGIFSMPDLIMVSEWSRVDDNESIQDKSMPNLQGSKNFSTSVSKGEERTIPKLTLKKLPKPFVSDSSRVMHKDSSISQQSENNINMDRKVTPADFIHSACSETPSTLSNLRRIHHCDRKCAPPCCERPDSPHLPVSGAGRLNEHAPSRTKRHHRSASSLMTDLSELKHDREDQAEVYPDSLSSVEDLWEGSMQTRPCASSSFLLERRMSCPNAVSSEYVSVKRRRHMTISGKDEDPRQPCVARERRRRPKPLSHRCACCMDQGSSRKRKKRKYRRREKAFDWEIPEVLSREQTDFIHNVTLLISLRHKVYRLCQVLFPKLASVWQLDPDTEQIDMLVMEITDVTRTVSSKWEMDTPTGGRMCQDSGGITLKSDNSEETVDKPDMTLGNVCEFNCDIQGNNGTVVEKTQTSSDETSVKIFSKSRSNSPDMNRSFPSLWKEENDVSDRCKQASESDQIKGYGGFEDTHPDLTEDLNSEPLIPNLNCCDMIKGDTKELRSPACDGDIEDELPLLECYASQLDSEGLAQDPESTVTDSTDNLWGISVLETIQEEPLAVGVSRLNHDSTCESLSTHPFSGPVRGPEYSPWGSTANESWEGEFMKYLRGHSVAPVGNPEGSAKSSLDKTDNPGTSKQTQSPSEVLDFRMLNTHVTLCKNPYLCLTRLRKKVILLLKPLLPNLTFENNFDKFSDDVDMLVELVIQSNETKEARATHSGVD
ncbi:uncharacterized protein LOC135481237 [Liolophura sinensis]|uniref:uncharacterized protein LOC135481237 n=1 Tax=Liolophura sinensis TaxID=3198878 RepID=UPI0031595D23